MNITNPKKLYGIIGSCILFIGVFMPVLRTAKGTINYVGNGTGDGIIILVLATISFVLVMLEKYKGLWVIAFASLAIMVTSFIGIQEALSDRENNVKAILSSMPQNDFLTNDVKSQMIENAMSSLQLSWGWGVLLIGVAFIILSASIKNRLT